LDCIIKSTLNSNDCKIETYNDIYDKVSNIKQRNAIAKDVRIYILQVIFIIIIINFLKCILKKSKLNHTLK